MKDNLTNLIAITTTRKPPSRVRQLVNELSLTIPNSFKIIRGHTNLEEITKNVYLKSCSKLILISSIHGNPATFTGYKISSKKNEVNLEWNFEWILKNVKLNNELKTKKLKNPVKDAQINFINIFPEIKQSINDFFNFSSKKDQKQENRIIWNIEYANPGFLMVPQNELSQKISPRINISEILLPDKTKKSE